MKTYIICFAFSGLLVYTLGCGASEKAPYVRGPYADTPRWVFQLCIKCPRIYLPVCGNDSKTYTNECKLNCLNYEYMKDPPVVVKRRGLCKGFP